MTLDNDTIIQLAGGGEFPPIYPEIAPEDMRQEQLIIATPPVDQTPWIEIGAGIITPLVVALLGIYIAKKK